MLPSIFRVLNLPGFPLLEFPQSQIVTLKYYSGLTSFYEEQYEKAHEDFMYAFQHCPRNAIKNKRYATDCILNSCSNVHLGRCCYT